VRISEDTINAIRERANIVQVIGEYVNLKASGKNYKGLCPFHSEKTPSFTVSPDKGIFHCFGCGTGGNIFTFITKIKGITFPDAVRLLGERYGISVTSVQGGDKGQEKYEALFTASRMAADIFHRNLLSEKGKGALNYLKGRGFDSETVKCFCLGYALDSWDYLFKLLRAKNFSPSLLEEAGLIVKNRSGTGFYDRFRNRIIFPIQDNIDRIIGFGGRTLDVAEQGIPKYINTNENAIFHKGKHLYGFHLASEHIRKMGSVFIVEGYLDVIRMHKEGLKNCVAPLGTALTDEQVSFLLRYTKRALLVFDPDEAGRKATLRSIGLFHRQGIDPSVILLPKGKDPGDFFDEYSSDDFRLLIEGAETGLDYIVKYHVALKNEYTANEKITILHTLCEYYVNMNDEILKIEFVKKISSLFSISEHIVLRELSKFIRSERIPSEHIGSTPKKEKMERWVRDELSLLLLLLSNPHLLPFAARRVEESDFDGKWTRKLWNTLLQVSQSDHWDSGTVFASLEDESFINYLSGKLMEEGLYINPENQLIDMVSKLKEKRIRERMSAIDARLINAELSNDERLTNELIVEKQACKHELEKMRVLRSSKTW